MAIYYIPSAVLFVVLLVLSVALVASGQLLVQRRFRATEFEQHNQVGGNIIAIAGTLYAVVLGFLTVVVWQQYQTAGDRLSSESAAVSDAWHTAVAYPQSLRSRLRRDMTQYATVMIQDEWPMMRDGGFSVEGDRLIMDMMSVAGTYVPRNLGEANAQSATVQSLVVLHDERLRRLSSNETGMSWLEWSVLGVGAFIIVTFCFLFGMRNTRTHVVMTSAVTVIIVSMIVIILELQYPFRGDLGIPPNAWIGLLNHIHYMDTFSPANMRM